MIPTNSSTTTNGCDNISSNCVIWQGPDIACINLCNGDTVSEVVAKLATEVCTIITDGVTANPNLVGLDLTCLNIPGVTPTTLVPVLQAMITGICTNNSTDLPTCTQVVDCLPIMNLPLCLEYDDPVLGTRVTQERLDAFASTMATKICNNYNQIQLNASTITQHGIWIAELRDCVLPCTGAVVEAQIVPTCVSNVGTPTNVSTVLIALEIRFCALESAVGLPSAINNAISQAVITGTYNTLTNTSVSYGSIAGWNVTPTNLAQSMQNAWVVIDDMYTAVVNIQNNCCPTGCDRVVFGYVTSNILTNGEITSLNFNFQGSTIPATFNDCAGSTVITISDALNNVITQTVSVSTLQTVSSGVDISLPTLNTNQNLSISVAFCATDGSDTCSDTVLSTVTGVVPCPAAITMSAISTTSATVSFVNLIGLTAVYTIDILDSSNVLVATFVQNSPGANVSHNFTGLIPGTNYTTRVTVAKGGTTVVCPNTTAFSTVSADALCNTGMDVAFILDYTASMGPEIEAIKAGIATVTSTIINESSSNDYRLGLALADEGPTGTPNYATSVDYVALPAAQKVINTGTTSFQYITGMEKFATNNTTTFQAQLAKINTGAPTADMPLGQGLSGPEPTDMAIGLIVEANEFLGAFRTNVAKYLIIITDALPSGDDDGFNATDVARLNSLQVTCSLGGIKCFVLGTGVNQTYTQGSTVTYPWRTFALGTNGNWNVNSSPATISSEIVNGCASPAP